jgi:sugar lactone lactonase YvrE
VIEVELVLDAGAELAEGPSWLAGRDELLWVDILAGRVHLFDPASGGDRSFEAGQPVGAAVPADDGRLALAARDGFVMLDLRRGLIEPVADVELELSGNRMNDGKCDSAGRFWAGTMATDMRPAAGALYRLDANRRVDRMVDGVGISNGLGWSPDDRLMYYVDSMERRIDVFDFDARSGAIAGRRPLVSVDGPGVPDGMAVDAEGGLWVAVWGAGRVLHLLPDGTAAGAVEVPASRPSSVCFGGPELRDLYITTARQGLRPERRTAEPHAGGIFRCRPGVAGQPTRAYRTRP